MVGPDKRGATWSKQAKCMSEATLYKQSQYIESIFSIGCGLDRPVVHHRVGKLTQTLPPPLRQLTHSNVPLNKGDNRDLNSLGRGRRGHLVLAQSEPIFSNSQAHSRYSSAHFAKFLAHPLLGPNYNLFTIRDLSTPAFRHFACILLSYHFAPSWCLCLTTRRESAFPSAC